MEHFQRLSIIAQALQETFILSINKEKQSGLFEQSIDRSERARFSEHVVAGERHIQWHFHAHHVSYVTCQIAACLERIGRVPTSRAKLIRVSFEW